jgi:glycerol uptake facilitator protein
LNPARDLGPRLISWACGWGSAAFPDQTGGFFLVYIMAPIAGAILASLFFVYVLEPAMNRSTISCNCDNDKSMND